MPIRFLKAPPNTNSVGKLNCSMLRKKIAQNADRAAAWCAVAFGFSIPISVVSDNLLLAFLLMFWIIGDVPGKMRIIRANRMAMVSLGFYLLLLLGSFYGNASLAEKTTLLVKYKGLLLFPLLTPLFIDGRIRKAGFTGFTAAIVLTLILSTAIWLGLIPTPNSFFSANAIIGSTVFRGHIAQSFLMAIAAYLYAVHASDATGKKRWLFALLSVGCIINVYFMIFGRTGYVVLAALILHFFLTQQRIGWKGLAVGLLILAGFATTAFVFSHHFAPRIEAAVHEAEQWNPKKVDHTSNGMRLEFYDNTLKIIINHPLFGVGTGGFRHAYRQEVAGSGRFDADNPHNESLLITAQLGVLGLAALLFFYFSHWRFSHLLPTRSEQRMAQALLISMIVGGLMNSLLINHTESTMFAWLCAWLYCNLNESSAVTSTNSQAIADTVG